MAFPSLKEPGLDEVLRGKREPLSVSFHVSQVVIRVARIVEADQA